MIIWKENDGGTTADHEEVQRLALGHSQNFCLHHTFSKFAPALNFIFIRWSVEMFSA